MALRVGLSAMQAEPITHVIAMDVDAGGRRICALVAPSSNQVLLEFENMLQTGGKRDAVSRGTIASTLIQSSFILK